MTEETWNIPLRFLCDVQTALRDATERCSDIGTGEFERLRREAGKYCISHQQSTDDYAETECRIQRLWPQWLQCMMPDYGSIT